MSRMSLSRRQLLKVSGTAAAAAVLPWTDLLAAAVHPAAAGSSGAKVPNDARLGPLKDLNGYFPFQPAATPEAWAARRDYVRRQILLSAGLWPMPERPEIQATVHGRIERDGYTIDRVFFESADGFLVTGSLYKPAEIQGPLPTILCPHGHWANGRFHDHGEAQLKREIESGAEQFEQGGRHPLQARSVQLARMGCLVFLYDMLGYADGGTLTEDLAHRFQKQRPELSSPDRWGLYSAQAELRLLNILGLQTWNSLRVLDWLTTRPDCDPKRLGVTGASGGGSQTFLLTAIDDRVAAAFPAVMVSTAMQGGCTCENASYLRVNTGNIEFAALAAPRPLSMSGANDWTVEIETKGLPELRQHYAMLGVPDHVQARHFPFPHNYNAVSRMMMYRFFNQFLNLGFQDDEIIERDFQPLTVDEATVFTDQYPAPAKTTETEVAFLRAWDAASNHQIAALTPQDSTSLAEFRRVIGGALEIMIGRTLPGAGSIEFENRTEEQRDGFLQYAGTLRYAKYGEEVPAAFLYPENWNNEVVLWIDGFGKSRLFNADGTPVDAVAKLLKAGYAIGSIDMLYTGEYTDDGQPVSEYRIVDNPREFAGYTLGYNHPLFAQRTHDLLSLISFAVHHPDQPKSLHLLGVGGAAPQAAAACALAQTHIATLALDTDGYRFGNITSIRDPNLLPGAVKYGDLPALMALCAPTALYVAGESAQTLTVTEKSCKAAGSELHLVDGLNGLVDHLRS